MIAYQEVGPFSKDYLETDKKFVIMEQKLFQLVCYSTMYISSNPFSN